MTGTRTSTDRPRVAADSTCGMTPTTEYRCTTKTTTSQERTHSERQEDSFSPRLRQARSCSRHARAAHPATAAPATAATAASSASRCRRRARSAGSRTATPSRPSSRSQGFSVDLQYAEDDIPTQVSQIENMITKGAEGADHRLDRRHHPLGGAPDRRGRRHPGHRLRPPDQGLGERRLLRDVRQLPRRPAAGVDGPQRPRPRRTSRAPRSPTHPRVRSTSSCSPARSTTTTRSSSSTAPWTCSSR